MMIVLLGFLFGVFIMLSELNKFDTISGMAILNDLRIAKALLVAIGIGIILIFFEVKLNVASYHLKPFNLGGVVIGGILFGVGMAILGYCPGTLIISAGEGSLDAMIGIVGGLVGGLVFTLLLPFVKIFIGPHFGKISIFTLLGNNTTFTFLVSLVISLFMIYSAFLLNKKDENKSMDWFYAGLLLGLLNPIIFLKFVQNRPIGASTAYPYIIDRLLGLTSNPYFLKIQKPGEWEVLFLLGAFVAGFTFSILRRKFELKLIQPRWEKYKGNLPLKRIFYAFVGGFILIFGARLAGGCTSGHILSGGMQLSISSIVFAVFVFLSLVITGRIFYR